MHAQQGLRAADERRAADGQLGVAAPREAEVRLLSTDNLVQALGSADLWIGVAIGAAFVAAAIYWRRYRDDSI